MKFAKDRPVKIVLLGAGGTGGHVAPHLYRLLNQRPSGYELGGGLTSNFYRYIVMYLLDALRKTYKFYIPYF